MSTSPNELHWCEGIRDVVLSLSANCDPPFKVSGGSENASFLQICNLRSEKLTYLRGNERLEEGETLLEVQNEKVSGRTSYDVQSVLEEFCRRGGPISLKTVKPGFLPTDLRAYLSLRFSQGSLDHELQNTIRENVYSKTVPCTTRERREGEVDGEVYRFISTEEFEALERNGELLESGIYEGNYYGTPKPPKVEEYELDAASDHLESSRKERGYTPRDIQLGDMPPLFIAEMKDSTANNAVTAERHLPPSTSATTNEPVTSYNNGVDDELGPLPLNWEIAYTETGEKYFIDHNKGITQWNHPGQDHSQQPVNESSEPLPPGWDRVEDPQYGVYYVDHINKITQYEKPVFVTPGPHKALFTLNPRELRGEMITTTLMKGQKGLGFTLVGNDGTSSEEEFLQIRNIINDGPAHKDGRLCTGDILVYVNNTCVLGYSQNDIVRIFQSINAGEPVTLRVCRGYPLLFDPSNVASGDIITQDAYSITGSDSSPSPLAPDLSATRAETVLVKIIKGDMGFGFTIADSPYGQKVKKILDKPRCRGLMENDVLCDINGHNVRKMGHAEIVDVLKDCPVGVEAILQVQRSIGTMRRSQTDISGPLQKPPSVPAKPTQRPHSYHPAYNGNGEWDRRSKTPTADLSRQYSESGGPSAASFVDAGPSVRPRSKTPGPIPSRPHKPNGHVTNGGGAHYPQRYESQGMGVPIYENLPRQARYGERDSASPTGGRPKTPSSSGFASATPNYVPASVYSRHYMGAGAAAPSVGRPAVDTNSRFSPVDAERREEQYEYINANLIKQPNGFGFRVVGGTEERTQTAVGQIVPGGAADKDGRLKMGDEIVEIDGVPMLGAAHQDAVMAMNTASQNGYVKLVIRRRALGFGGATIAPAISSDYHPINRQPVEYAYPKRYPYDVTVVRNDSEGFGFQIVSSVYRSGSCIGSADASHQNGRLLFPSVGKIIEGSPAARCGNLRVNDRIVKINGVNILRMHHGEIVNLIRDSGNVVTLTVGAPEDSPLPSAPIVNPASVVPLPREMNATERRHSLASVIETIERATPPSCEMLEYRYDMMVSEPPSPNGFSASDQVPHYFGPTYDSIVFDQGQKANSKMCFSVDLQRGSKGFGFSIRGGQEFDNMPLLVLRIAEGGPAYVDGRLQVGDQLTEINGVSTVGMAHAEAIELIKREPVVHLVVKRQPELPADTNSLVDPLAENPYGRLGGDSGNSYPQRAVHQPMPAPSWPVVR